MGRMSNNRPPVHLCGRSVDDAAAHFLSIQPHPFAQVLLGLHAYPVPSANASNVSSRIHWLLFQLFGFLTHLRL